MADNEDGPPPLGYAGPRTGRLVAIARFPHDWMAAVAVTKLESEGIVVELVETTASHGLGTRAATIAVQADQVDDALAILANTPARDYVLAGH